MARLAQKALAERTVEVNRLRLITTLEENKKKHIRLYNEAIAGYKNAAMKKLEEDGVEARKRLERNLNNAIQSIADFDPDKPHRFGDHFVLVQEIMMTLKVPKSYESAYNAAIDIANWDVNETMMLTFAEFNCFVRDEWDWKEDFMEVSNFYTRS